MRRKNKGRTGTEEREVRQSLADFHALVLMLLVRNEHGWIAVMKFACGENEQFFNPQTRSPKYSLDEAERDIEEECHDRMQRDEIEWLSIIF